MRGSAIQERSRELAEVLDRADLALPGKPRRRVHQGLAQPPEARAHETGPGGPVPDPPGSGEQRLAERGCSGRDQAEPVDRSVMGADR